MIFNVSTPAISLVKLAHQQISHKVKAGDSVIDATVGNGYDTLFLLNLVGANGTVYGFDIQPSAIAATKAHLQQHPQCENVKLIQDNHAKLQTVIPAQHRGRIKAIMFNLGYLPGGDKQIITQVDSTLTALAVACELLAKDGILTVLAYPGHTGGDLETQQVKDWCLRLSPAEYQVNQYLSTDKPTTPILFCINKLANSV